MTGGQRPCPSCQTNSMAPFYHVAEVPTNSVLLLSSEEEARDFPRGTIDLGFCSTCGFVSNMAFNPALTEYSGKYESTQGFSPTFNRFHKRLAQDLIERFDLRDKTVIEIGCGTGDFLILLSDLGENQGIGFDPAFVPGRHPLPEGRDITFVQDFYSEKYTDRAADFFCCKMTLEHIPDTAEFVGMVRRAVGNRPDAIIFFQVPNARYVFGDLAFWDVYYEHCSYFSSGSLARLFQNQGFDVLDLWTDYDDQYLMIAARPASGEPAALPDEAADMESLRADVAHFQDEVPALRRQWRERFDGWKEAEKRVVLWGGGSKGVAFLTTLGLTDEVGYVVDINPHKEGTYMAGTGHEIVLPEFLREYRPDAVVIMNPIYRAEIAGTLHGMGLEPEILTL